MFAEHDDTPANSIDLTDREREWVGFMLADALMPYGKDFDPAEAARVIEGRIGALLAARGERGYRQAWAARSTEPLRFDPPTFDYSTDA